MTTVLFSPIGDTDPIRGGFDGSMLHIVRHFHPDVVCLYLSKEMQGKAGLCTWAIEQLAAAKGWEIQVEVIRKNVNQVQRFDFFYREFSQELLKIEKNHLGPGDKRPRILLNISSGTPAMKSGLMVVNAFNRFACQAIQVDTPARGSNRKNRDFSDVYASREALWASDRDNDDYRDSDDHAAIQGVLWEDEHAVQGVLPLGKTTVTTKKPQPRWHIDPAPNLLSLFVRDQLKNLVKNYDYQAAERLVRDHAAIFESETLKLLTKLLTGVRQRLELDREGAVKGNENSILAAVIGARPGEPGEPDPGLVFEALEALDVRRRQERWSDFVRFLTPCITYTLALWFDSWADNDLWQLTDSGYQLTETGRTHFAIRPEAARPSFLTNRQLFGLLLGPEPDNARLTEAEREQAICLQSFEDSFRNVQAHQLAPLATETIGQQAEQVVEALRQLFQSACQRLASRPAYEFSSYSQINETICRVPEPLTIWVVHPGDTGSPGEPSTPVGKFFTAIDDWNQSHPNENYFLRAAEWKLSTVPQSYRQSGQQTTNQQILGRERAQALVAIFRHQFGQPTGAIDGISYRSGTESEIAGALRDRMPVSIFVLTDPLPPEADSDAQAQYQRLQAYLQEEKLRGLVKTYSSDELADVFATKFLPTMLSDSGEGGWASLLPLQAEA